MAYQTDFLLPALGEGDGGRIVSWLKQPGETFENDEPVLEIETDKAVIEVPAPAAGKLLEYLAEVDDLVEIDEAIARIELEGDAPEDAKPAPRAGPPEETTAKPVDEQTERMSDGQDKIDSLASHDNQRALASGLVRPLASPYARKLALEQGIDLHKVTGSGKSGRIIGADVNQSGARVRNVRVSIAEDWVSTSGGRVFVKSWFHDGDNTNATLVLLHGLFADTDVWASTANSLARRGVRVVGFDLPCHGRTTEEATQFDAIVGVTAEAIRQKVSGPITLVGHSFGGAVAARIAATAGLQITGLGLIAPVGLGTEINASFLDGMTHAGTVEVVQRELRKLTVKNINQGREFLDAMREQLDRNAASLREICSDVAHDGVQQITINDNLEQLDVPLVIVQGRGDRVIPWQHALSAPPKTALHLIPDAGHMPQWEAGSLVTDIIQSLCIATLRG